MYDKGLCLLIHDPWNRARVLNLGTVSVGNDELRQGQGNPIQTQLALYTVLGENTNERLADCSATPLWDRLKIKIESFREANTTC
jgi:hypothetical protein